ncbi:MAG: 4Fe-4S binding protein [Christensenellales bacterium]|jgi:electron transport complex protein RnfB
MKDILLAALILGGMGVVLGLVLTLANRFLGVEKDADEIHVRELLPGANCGGCGYPGCDAMAKAIVTGEAPINGCPVNTPSNVAAIAKVLGVEAKSIEPLTTIVACRGALSKTHLKYHYEGVEDCAAAMQLTEGYKACRFACLGLGNCTQVCPTGAIRVEDGLAVIDENKCITCGKCVAACPRGIIIMIPKRSPVQVLCRNHTKGREVREVCDMGCLACGLCARRCPFGAITMRDDLPVFDYSKCTGCGVCVDICPNHCITKDVMEEQVAFIMEDLCNGCGKCQETCKFSAIEGENGDKRKVDPDKCRGCQQCGAVCPEKAIRIIHK